MSDQLSTSTGSFNNPLTANRKNLIAVLDQANRIASMTSLDELLDQMLELMIQVSEGEAGTLYLLDQAAGELVFKVVKGEKSSPEFKGLRIRQDQGIVGAAVQQRELIVIEDIAKDPRWYRDMDPEKTAHLRNVITLPLLLQGKPIGAVQIFNFVHAELELLQILGNRMASEVDKVMLLDKSHRTNRRLQALVDILGQVGATLDREQLLRLLAELATQLMDAEKSSVMLAERQGEEMMLVSDENGKDRISPAQRHGFLARSAVSAPLRARPITVGKERIAREERVIGNLLVLNKNTGAFDAEDTQLLEILANHASTILQIAGLYAEANELFLDFIKVLAATIDAKDPYTRGHSQRVSDFSVAIAKEMRLSPDLVHDIQIGSLLHDIGKIGVPDYIITKPDQLTNDEFEQMKRHPTIGYRIMSQVHLISNVLPAISEHHERVDGSGYPLGLHGDQISQIGLIVSVADVFDAMTTNRPYRSAMEIDLVFDHLHENIDRLYNRQCVEALIQTVIQSRSR